MRRLPPLRALRAFEAAARHLSFARAADELHVTPAAISQQVKSLEAHLGVALFHRTPHLALTAAAAAALPMLGEAFDRLERGVERLQAGRDGGPLVVSAPPSFAARWLIPRLDGFQAAHPSIELRLATSTRLVDFETEDVDLAIRYGPGHYPGLSVERLKSEAAVVVVHPRLAENLIHPADLAQAVLLHNEAMDWDPTWPDWPNWLRQAGIEPPDRLRLRPFGDANLVIQAAMAGLGAALVWETLVTEELDSGRLVALFPSQPLANAYHLVAPPGRLDSPKVAAFMEWIRREAQAPARPPATPDPG
jgi:LysR family glycine cleavage system transcriptional activator